MIYTVTLNPSLDYNVKMDSLKTGLVNRTEEEVLLPGGKGINVSSELHYLGVETTALGIVAGFTGEEIVRLVKERGVHADFIRAGQGFSRINMKINHGENTGVNGRGPQVGKEEMAALYWRLDMLEEDDILVLSGSIPSGVPESVYTDIVKHLDGRGVRIAANMPRKRLMELLPYHPFLVKPSFHDLEEHMSDVIRDRDKTFAYARELREQGACNVAVPTEEFGVVLVTQDGQELYGIAPHDDVVNVVGVGDAFVAGFLAGYLDDGDYCGALRLGIAAACASVSETEFAQAGHIWEFARKVEIIGNNKSGD